MIAPDAVTVPEVPASALRIDSRRAEFADLAVENSFNQHHLPTRNAQLKVSLLFCAAFYVAFGATDLATLGVTTTAWLLVASRILVALCAAGGCIAVTRRPDSVALSVAVASVVETLGMLVFMVLCWYQPSATAWNALSLALMVTAVYINIPNRLTFALPIAAGFSLLYAGMVVAQNILNMDDLIALVLLLLLGNALGYVGARRYHLAQREQFRAAIMLQQLADRDPLTGCGNRRILQKGLLDAELARARRFDTSLSVILCDIDHFKRINDTHGHAAGDQVIIAFAALLRSMTRDTVDRVIRYGGEEFMLVLPETDLDGAMMLAERIRHALATTTIATDDDTTIDATASFGVAAIEPPHGEPGLASTLVRAADEQMYGAKHAGRNRVRGMLLGGMPRQARA